ELARTRPSSLAQMRLVYGIGDAKLRDFGEAFLEVIERHSRERRLARDVANTVPRSPDESRGDGQLSVQRRQAFELFRSGASIESVVEATGRSRNTVLQYLCEYIRRDRPLSLVPWVTDEVYAKIAEAARKVGTDKLKPIYVALGEQIDYALIRIVRGHL